MTLAQVIALNPTVFKETLEDRIAQLSDLIDAQTTELAILRGELRLLSGGHKSSLEVKNAFMTQKISM